MIKIEGNTIKVHRGDRGTIQICKKDEEGNIENFQQGDILIFSVKRNFSSNEYVIRKTIPITEECQYVNIDLTKEDTTIGELISKPKAYQYDICLNEDETILGYDDDGPKEFIVYPEGSNDE